MPLDNIGGFGMRKVEPRDYTVISVGQSGLLGKDNLTLGEAFKLRDSLPSGTAIVVVTKEILGTKCYLRL